MEQIKASIIITTRNRCNLLETRSLPSALNQLFPNFEVIIIDDASTDNTEEAIKKYARPGLTYIKNTERKSLAFGRNEGVRKAKGEYIVWLDDDDELDLNFLKLTVPVLENLPKEYGAISCARWMIYPEGTAYHGPRQGKEYCSIDDGFLIRRSVFETVQNDESLPTDEDADFGLNFLKHFKLFTLDKPLLIKHGHPIINTAAYSHPNEWRLDGLRKFIAKDWSEFQKLPSEWPYMNRMAGRTFCLGGLMDQGISYLLEAYYFRTTLRNWLNLTAAYCGKRIFTYYYILEQKYYRRKEINANR